MVLHFCVGLVFLSILLLPNHRAFDDFRSLFIVSCSCKVMKEMCVFAYWCVVTTYGIVRSNFVDAVVNTFLNHVVLVVVGLGVAVVVC